MPTLIEISEATVASWGNKLTVESYGKENTYYIDEFGTRFFCKNYPNTIA